MQTTSWIFGQRVKNGLDAKGGLDTLLSIAEKNMKHWSKTWQWQAEVHTHSEESVVRLNSFHGAFWKYLQLHLIALFDCVNFRYDIR